MIYLCRHPDDRAACETEASAARLEARGYVRCSAAEHARRWAEANMVRRAELAVEDAPQRQPATEPEPIAPPPAETKIVYASLGRSRP